MLEVSKAIEDSKKRLNEESKEKERLELLLSSLMNEQKLLDNHPVKEESIIFTAKIEVEKKKEEIKALEESLSQRDALINEIEALSRVKTSLESKQKKYTLDIQHSEKRAKELKVELRNMEIEHFAARLASHLHHGESCPVCGSKEHPNPVKDKEIGSLDKKQEELLGMETMVARLKEEKTKLDINLAEITKEYHMKSLSLETIGDRVKNQSIEEMKKEAKELEEELEKLSKDREIYINERNKLEEAIDQNKERLNNVSNMIAGLNIELQKDSKTYDSLSGKNDQLIQNIRDLSTSLEAIKNHLKIENIAVEYDRMKGRDKERSKKEKELKELRIIAEEKDRQKETLEHEINCLKLDLAKNKQQIEEYKKQLNAARENIKRLAEGKPPKEYRLALENKVKEVEEAEKTLKARVEKGKDIQQKKLEEKAIAESNKATLEGDYRVKSLELQNKAKEQGFESVEDMERYLLEESELMVLEKKILDYDDQVKDTDRNMERINSALDGKALTEEAWISLQTLLRDKKQIQVEKVKEIGETEQVLKDIKMKLENIKELKKEEQKITHKLDLLLELSKMLEGNRFVEYVAINQLKYIAKEASRWLKDITRGRYALELDSSGNFVMRDDFNGGIRRATNTLSGGETFLTSLSLALALSSHIQLKGSTPLEFFFLDEGFGTLDGDLLEIVMTALERLHSEKLSVGIISHVEELKNRVPIKLLVSPPEFGGVGTIVKIV